MRLHLLSSLSSNFVSLSETSANDLETKLKNAFTTISGGSYAVNKSYPVMLVFAPSGGSGFSGALTGTFNMTSGGIRFLIADETHMYQGLFLRSNNTISSVTDLNSKFVYETVTFDAMTVPSGDRGVFSKDVTKTGYTPIGIIAVSMSSNTMALGSFSLSNNTAQVVVHNISNASASQTIGIRVLYMKS